MSSRVLFVCEGNRARSQMAEALLRSHGGHNFEVLSAGIRPGDALPQATIDVMDEIGVPVSGQRPKHFTQFGGETFDYVITVCDKAAAALREPQGERIELPAAARSIHWSVEDPADAQARGLTLHEALREARRDLRSRIVGFLAEQGCVFCRIVTGEEPASFLYRDDLVLAFMDIRPITEGHALVIPLQHFETMEEAPEETAGRMAAVGGRIAAALRHSGVRMEGYNFFVANGEAAGQEVFHVHLHVLPRFRGDGFGFRFPPGYGEWWKTEQLDEVAEPIRRALDRR